jgi:hypothetical protein
MRMTYDPSDVIRWGHRITYIGPLTKVKRRSHSPMLVHAAKPTVFNQVRPKLTTTDVRKTLRALTYSKAG